MLDLGGRTGILRRFLPEHDVVLVDVEASQEPGLVLGDGSRLPFRDRSFDELVACDTLEHVPVARRAAFVAETARVARRHVVLAGPYRTEGVEEAEERLREFLRAKLGLAHRYLDEHAAHGLPGLDETSRAFASLGARTAHVGHGNLDRWLALLCLSMYMDEDRHLRTIARRMYRFYNRALYPSDVLPPVYRHAVVAALGNATLPDLEALFAPPVALPMSLEPFAGLVAELAAFDHRRDVFDAERGRLEEVVAALARDLEGHRRAKAELETDLEGHRRAKAAIEVDLAGHRATLEEARARIERQEAEIGELGLELEAERARSGALEHEVASQRLVATEVARDLAGHREVAGALERDLAGHRALLEEVRRDLAEHAKLARELELELGLARAAAAKLEAELAAVRGEARALEAEAARANQLASATNDRLVREAAERARLEAEVARMLAELRSRKANLARAFKARKPLY